MKSRETIQDVSTRIRGLTKYGVRDVRFDAPGYVLTWSNSSASWGRGYYQNKMGEVMRLDANQTVAYVQKGELDAMLPLLPDLPLYGNSTEASSGRGRLPTPDTESRCNCNLKASDIPDSHFDARELQMGIVDEMEHTNSPAIAKAISKGHLVNHPHYYTENKKRHCL